MSLCLPGVVWTNSICNVMIFVMAFCIKLNRKLQKLPRKASVIELCFNNIMGIASAKLLKVKSIFNAPLGTYRNSQN